jgi:hypothetical protein
MYRLLLIAFIVLSIFSSFVLVEANVLPEEDLLAFEPKVIFQGQDWSSGETESKESEHQL